MHKVTKIAIWVVFVSMVISQGFVVAINGPSHGPIKSPSNQAVNHRVSRKSKYMVRHPLDLTKLFPGFVIDRGNPKNKVLALTFDDGPDAVYTPLILDVLKKYHIKATFFVVGTQIEKNPAVFKRIVQEGHVVGSHGYQHLSITKLPAAKIMFQLDKDSEIIAKNGGFRPVLYRPPYGAVGKTSAQLVNHAGYKIILWTIDSLDWRGLNQRQVLANVGPKLRNGYIILQHCGFQTKKENLTGTVEALPEIIKIAQRQGYRFVTISELLIENKCFYHETSVIFL